ncbi:hypothetical protein [Dyella mobilis]|uniref:Uncharacterized protein n=1 Tax=Dyella mobilis TaxID=1849582 RepID=A0ABS2KEM1_9GAMM|nr:hypothetical protein [Dyella mobilis]MBM7129616.1 hypothetical protein [Dyella mobilis]GLQ98119.1 hypothetical protein GCM10007863_25390 [Dyella mobilis]
MSGKKTWAIGLLLLVAVLGAGIYAWKSQSGANRPAATIATANPPQQAAKPVVKAPAATSGSTTDTYANDRFNFTVNYPTQLLVPGKPADNDDGLRFAPKSGDADIRAWGEYNANEDSPAALLKFDLDHDCAKDKVSYRVSKPDLVAYSCLNPQGRVVYQKVIIRDDTLASVRFEYDTSEQATWAPVIKQMAGSLNLGPDPVAQELR